MILVSFQFNQLAVLNMGYNTATTMAAGTGRPGGCFDFPDLFGIHLSFSMIFLNSISRTLFLPFLFSFHSSL
jgi:hypothetical protein